MELTFDCTPTAIGSLPYIDTGTACKITADYLPDLPAWPQLPRRTNLENMYIQFSEGFPGIAIDGQTVSVDDRNDIDHQLEKLFSDSFDNKWENYTVSEDFASCLYCTELTGTPNRNYIKGQIIGPVSWGLCVTDHAGKGIIYNDILAESSSKFLRLKATWQEQYLKKSAEQTVIFLDEPYLSSLGSAFVALHPDQIRSLISEVLNGISGIKGIHCCGATDWPLLLNLPIHIISFDAYNYIDSILCYQPELSSFVNSGRCIAWGIVPNDENILNGETAETLFDRLCANMTALVCDGLTMQDVAHHSLITPTCGLASLSSGATEYALKLLNDISRKMKRKYLS